MSHHRAEHQHRLRARGVDHRHHGRVHLHRRRDGASFECALDGQGYTDCTSPAIYTGLSLGTHLFSVRATDPAGNTDPTPATFTWTITAPEPEPDTTAPNTSIGTGPEASTTETTAGFTFTADEDGASFECALDGQGYTDCTSPAIYTGLSLGTHLFSVRATDPAGNTDPTPATLTWTITAPPADCGAPVTVLASADSWLDENSATTNKGSDAILNVRSKGPRDNFRALVRFALPPLPPGCAIESATLRLHAASSTRGRSLEAIRVTGTWTENGVHWANQPTTTGPVATTPSAGGYREWTVATQVQSMYDSGINQGFLIRDAVEGADAEQQFHGREKGDSPPHLVLRFARR